jgi:hypothetical protein
MKPRKTAPPTAAADNDPQAKLDAWLDKHDARCSWSHELPNGTLVAGWIINGRVAVTMRFPKGGWDIYTGSPAVDVPNTLTDAEQRLGLVHPTE